MAAWPTRAAGRRCPLPSSRVIAAACRISVAIYAKWGYWLGKHKSDKRCCVRRTTTPWSLGDAPFNWCEFSEYLNADGATYFVPAQKAAGLPMRYVRLRGRGESDRFDIRPQDELGSSLYRHAWLC